MYTKASSRATLFFAKKKKPITFLALPSQLRTLPNNDKSRTLQMHHTFWKILPSLYDYGVKFPNFTFYEDVNTQRNFAQKAIFTMTTSRIHSYSKIISQ